MELLWLVTIFGLPLVTSNFVQETNTHEYSIDINERGTNLTQRVKFDEENNLTIIHVPSHNELDETTYVIDNIKVSNN